MMEGFTLVTSVAILLEGLVEYAKTVIDLFEKGERKTAIIQAFTIVGGILLALIFNLSLFHSLNMVVDPLADHILTGIVISRGSNYVSDLIGRIAGQKVVAIDSVGSETTVQDGSSDNEDGSLG